jgi:3'-phosphoadenosine 5'-phosphosulfate sulfotransferase
MRARRNTADYDMDVSSVTFERNVSIVEQYAREVIDALDMHAERLWMEP